VTAATARHRLRDVGLAVITAVICCSGCSDPNRERLKATTKATYDERTGRLKELTSDSNGNGRIDTWTEMDGNRALRSRMDRNEDFDENRDGRIDRRLTYQEGTLVLIESEPDAAGKLTKRVEVK
jgi:hypothetical protein